MDGNRWLYLSSLFPFFTLPSYCSRKISPLAILPRFFSFGRCTKELENRNYATHLVQTIKSHNYPLITKNGEKSLNWHEFNGRWILFSPESRIRQVKNLWGNLKKKVFIIGRLISGWSAADVYLVGNWPSAMIFRWSFHFTSKSCQIPGFFTNNSRWDFLNNFFTLLLTKCIPCSSSREGDSIGFESIRKDD